MVKKKIIFFHPYSSYGGADLSISKLIDVVPFQFDIDFVTLSEKPKIKFYTKKKFRIIQIKKTKTLYAIKELRNILKAELLKYKKVILLSNQNYANISALIASYNLKRLKKIVFERNHISELDFASSFHDNLKKKLIKFMMKHIYRSSDLIIGNSAELCKDLQIYTGLKVKKLENFYNFNQIKKNSKRNIRSKLKFKKNIMINVGRLTEQKNQILLLKAFLEINKVNKNINLLIIGNGPEKKNILNFILKKKLGKNVQLLTNINNSLPYIKLSDIYVSTSKYEGFPNIIIEALTLSKPIISINYKSGLSEILNYGKGGVIIRNNYIKNISSQVLSFFKNKNSVKKKTLCAKKGLNKYSFNNGKIKFLKIINGL